jgi:hypothetical protein
MNMTDQIIEAKVDEFVADSKGFTSVDIANAIKTDGTWVGNREVAKFLRRWTPPSNYGITKVTVQVADTGGTAQAGVYLPDTLSVSDYTATSQEAMTPDQFEALHGVSPFPPPAPAKDYVVTDSDDSKPTVGDKLRTMFKWPKTAQ